MGRHLRIAPLRALTVAVCVAGGVSCGKGLETNCEQVNRVRCERVEGCYGFPYDNGTPEDPDDDLADIDACIAYLSYGCESLPADPAACVHEISNQYCYSVPALPASCDEVVAYPE